MKNVFHVFSRMFTKFLGERLSKLAISLCVVLFASTTAFAEKYISDVMVIGGDKTTVDQKKSDYEQQGWTLIDKDLNAGAGDGSDYVYILYKKSSEGSASSGFITDFIIKTGEYPDSFTFNGRTYYRAPYDGSDRFDLCGGDLNSGTTNVVGLYGTRSTRMRLYYTKDEFPDKRVVSDIAFTVADNDKVRTKSGYTTVGENGGVVGTEGSGAMDLNDGAGGKYIYMHFATVTSLRNTPEYISDVVVFGGTTKDKINSLKDRYSSQGWIVIDKDLNADASGDYIYMAYKKSHFSDVNKGFITDFIIRTGDSPDSLTFNGRIYYRAPNFGDGNFAINGGNLNSGTGSSSMDLWLYFTRESFPDSRVVSDIAFTTGNVKTMDSYTTVGENGAVVGSNGSGAMDLNDGAGGDYIYMHFATVSFSRNAPEYISDVVVFGGPKDRVNTLKDRYTSQGWIVVDQDLNDGAGSGTDYIYIAYKKSHFSDVNKGFITNFIIKTGSHPDQYTFEGREYYLAPHYGSSYFESYGGNLNSKAKSGSTNMWLYFTRESFPDKRVVSDIAITTGSGSKIMEGYTTLGKNGAAVGSDGSGAMDLNEDAGGKYIYMHFAKAPYVNVEFITGLNNVSVPTQTIVLGSASTKPSYPTCDGKFVGWFTTDNGNTEFDFSTPVTSNTKVYARWWDGDLSAIVLCNESYVAENGYVLRGELANNSKISIADGATVTLKNATINGVSDENNKYKWAGITCMGDCNIVLDGVNSVKGFWEDYPGIYVPEGYTMTIQGSGSLDASSNGFAPGIGGGFRIGCGNINIRSGTVIATGGKNAAGIGLGEARDSEINCGDITIASGVTRVTARGGEDAPYSIGLGKVTGKGKSSVGAITIDGKETGNVSQNPFTFPKIPYTVVFDKNGGEGAMNKQSLYIGTEMVLNRNTYTREGYRFAYWNTEPNGNGATYVDGATVDDLTDEANATVKLYAQWWNGDLSMLLSEGSYVAKDGYVLRGELASRSKILIADGATVTLDGVIIDGYIGNATYEWQWPGITCEGDCKIILKGDNLVKSFGCYSGIYVPAGSTLTIDGDGSLEAIGYRHSAGIGAGYKNNSGNIIIKGGSITARGECGAGIGGGLEGSSGNITISGGTVTARGRCGAGIGSGYEGSSGSGNITISGGTVTATGGYDGAGIGSGYEGSSGNITISGGTVTATGGYDGAGIGGGYEGSSGNITISGGTVTATGGSRGAGIGGGFAGSSGAITITDRVLKVTAKRGDKASYSIGKGIYSSVGVLMVGGEETSPITKQTFIYLPYGVGFNANGGRGTMESQRFFYDAAPVSLRQNTFVRDGYIFVGWNTMADGSGTDYADGAKVQNLTDEAGGKVTLFAQWIQNLPYIDEKGKEQVMQFGEYSLLTSLTDVSNLPSGWYVVFDNVEYSSAMKSTGNLNIILADGAKLACGIEAKNLAIYGQEKQTGRLTIYGSSIEESFSVNGGSLIFGWTSTDNRISADKYFHNKGSIKFADDQAFMDEQGNIYSAKLINWRISDIAGKTLVPYLDESYVAQDGAVLTGSLTGGSSLSYKISIADGATVTFDNVTINGVSDKYFKMAGITCLGNCMIILKGKNSVMGFWEDYPGIYVPVGKTLTIEGGKNDTLYASSNGWAPGIGGGFGISCGNIKIMGGNVFATGGKNSAGIGLGEVRDGVVTSCGNITIASGVTKVMATGGEGAPYSIGIGKMTGSGKSSVGTITIDDKETGNVSVNPYVYYPYTIVFDKNGGAGVMANLTINFDDEKTLQQNRFNRDDYFFVGWNTKANGKGDSYLDGAKVKNLTDAGGTITLYAQWQKFNGDLSVLVNDGSYVAEDGYVLRGALASNSKILIADGASVTLKNVTIEGFSDKNNKYEWAGITCLGDCKIILEGSNKVKGFWEDYPGIHVLEGKTLTIEGGKNDTLYASSNGWAPGLGGGFGISCGNIKIMGGNVFATGGKNSAGIGLGEVRDGVVTSCGDITIASEVTKVMATGGEDAPYSIGLGKMTGSGQSSVGTITIGGEETGNISISPYVYHPYTIVFNKNGGTGVMANQILSIDFEKSLKRNAFSRDGYNFIGWNTMADGKGDSYLDGAKVKNLTDAGGSITLYAQWRDGNVMDLSTLANDYIVRNGGLLFGTLDGQKQPYKISIADGATVTLKNVTIEGYSDFNDKNNKYEWAGITCLGDCKIILEGLNNVKGFWEDYPGIHVPEGKTLTIEGGENDTLYVSSNGWASGIGGGFGIGCGNIKIMSGVVFATGGKNAAGIGLGEVRDGVVTSCGDITIASEVTKVIAKKGAGAPYSIGIGKMTGSGQSSVGIITIGGEESGNVSTSPFIFPAIPYTVVFNKNGGEGSMDDQTLYIGNKFALNRNTFTCEGYVFAGWNTDPNGNGVAYEDGAVVMDMTNQANATVTLYAQWLECGHITNLEKLKYDYVARDGDVLIGKYDGYYHYQISIDDGATVTLYGVNFSSDHWDGLTCLGNCKIILKGENIVNGRYSGIYVPVNRTLTIEGDGLLEARGIEYLAVGLGCGHGDQCGNIEINSGVVIATGGDFGVGIGCAGFECSIGDITINGGAVTAIGGRNAAGIGCVDYECSFGDITITDSVQKVTVMSRGRAVYSIGGDDYDSHYGTITIGGEKTGPIGDNPFIFQTYGMVFDANGGSGTMEKQRFVYNANPTALSKNTFTRDGLVFAGWNTKADGSGTAYADGAKVQNLTDEAGGKVTLYAQWAVPYIDENGAEQIKQLGEYTVLTGKMDMSNLSSGWYVVADEVKCYTRMKSIGDLNIILADGANFACGVDVENITIYGQSQQTGKFTSYGINVKQNFTINGGNVVHGWTNADDLISIEAYNYVRGGVKIADGQVFKDEHDNIYSGELTAVQFSVIAGNVLYPSYFVVTFDAQNGSDAISVSTVSDDKNDAHVLAPDEPTREGYKFMGWFTTADGDAKFDFSAPVTRNTTVYAQWNKITNTFAAITICKDKDEKVHATIDGSYAGVEAVSIDDENGIVVDNVVLDRTLSTIGYATITLPFDIDSAKVKGAKQFLKFVGVILNEETKLREVHFERAWCDLPALLEDIDNLKDLSDEEKKEKKEKVSAKCNAAPKKLFAYTPYVVQMKGESLSFEDGVTLVKTPDAAETVVNNWVFRGTLAPKTWEEGDPEIGNAYGYVAGTGEFRKVGDNSSIGALRSYLVYEKRSSANIPAGASTIRANFSTEFLQANMDVVIVDDDENGKEHRTVIGKFNTRTGEFKFTMPESGTFDVKGRRVNETRSVGKGRKAKGVYYGKRGGRD